VDRRPGIFQIGTVRDDGDAIYITGWSLALCAAGCHCHRHPVAGNLTILEDQIVGTLGIVSYRPGCGCCRPWTAEELVAVLRDLADIDAIPSVP
jgi:hypothetical protein